MANLPRCIGGMAEWFKAHAWKACWGESPSGVRIPLPPPLLFSKRYLKILQSHSL